MNPAPTNGAGVIINASSPTKDSLDFSECLAAFLSQHKVPTVLLIECSTAADAATSTNQLQPVCTSSTTHLSLTQPLNTDAAFSAAVTLLNLPSSHLAVIQLGDKDNLKNAGVDSPPFQGLDQVLHLSPENNSIRQLFSLVLLHISSVMKRAYSSLVCIGYSMKQARQKALTEQNMLPFLPVDGTFFLPVDLEAIAQPFQEGESEGNRPMVTIAEEMVDVFLHKATDFFEDGNEKNKKNETEKEETNTAASMATASGSVPQYRPELKFILDKLHSSGCCIIDPLENLEKVIDRVQMADALDAACKAARKLALPVRAPAWHLIEHKFSPDILRTASTASKVSLPCVVKPQVACGIEESHQMAFVLHPSGLHSDLEVPLPALLQEYVDHNSTVWKVYVAGNQVFSVQKRSTPDLQPLRDFLASHVSSGEVVGNGGEEEEDLGIPTSIEFNSLESLPTSLPWLRRLIDSSDAGTTTLAPVPPAALMHPGFLTQLAQVFRKHLGLTLFGFDVVFDYAAGEAVVLDLNFFPSFRGIPEAPVALRTTLLEIYKTHKESMLFI
ncbi:hypothetical protein Ndes2526B_g01335 [Nannochloris sp. 'desiccata']